MTCWFVYLRPHTLELNTRCVCGFDLLEWLKRKMCLPDIRQNRLVIFVRFRIYWLSGWIGTIFRRIKNCGFILKLFCISIYKLLILTLLFNFDAIVSTEVYGLFQGLQFFFDLVVFQPISTMKTYMQLCTIVKIRKSINISSMSNSLVCLCSSSILFIVENIFCYNIEGITCFWASKECQLFVSNDWEHEQHTIQQ